MPEATTKGVDATWARVLAKGVGTAAVPETTGAPPPILAEPVAAMLEASATGQAVVYNATVAVFRTVDSAGQFVTVAAHLVIVETNVVYTVDVVSWISGIGAEVEMGISVSVTGQIVV